MTKRDNILAAIKGQTVQGIPAGFWLHFEKDFFYGEPAVKAHLDFMQATGSDILKIMNENLVPFQGDIRNPDDWNQIKTPSMKDDYMQHQVEMVKRILDECKEDVLKLGTIHGVVASAIHPIEARYGYEPVRELFCNHLRQKPQPIVDAFRRITEGMCILAEEYLKAGLDGIYYAALGGEKHYFTDDEFAELVKPNDLQILSTVKNSGGINVLHMCKNNLNLARYCDYIPICDIANWGVYEQNISLEEGRKLFGDITILGGLKNRSGVLVDGSMKQIANEVQSVIDGFGTDRLIIGADCTLPTEIDYNRIRTAIDAAHSYRC